MSPKSLKIVRKSLSLKKSLSKRLTNNKELKKAIQIEESLQKSDKMEQNKAHQHELDKAMKEIKKKEKKSQLSDSSSHDNQMIEELIDLCYEGNSNKCYNIFNLIEHYCEKDSSNRNTLNTIRILAYKLGLSESEVEGKSHHDLCKMILYEKNSPGFFKNIMETMGYYIGGLFTWSVSGVILRLKKLMITKILETRPFIYNSIFTGSVNANTRTKASWLAYSEGDLQLLDDYIKIVERWKHLGKPIFFQKLGKFKMPLTRPAVGKLSSHQKDELERLSKILMYIHNKVSEHKKELSKDSTILKEVKKISAKNHQDLMVGMNAATFIGAVALEVAKENKKEKNRKELNSAISKIGNKPLLLL